MYWLAVERQKTSLSVLEKDLSYPHPVAKGELFEATESLLRRSMIKAQGTFFTLQPVIMEYVTERFVEQVSTEIEQEKVSDGLFCRHALIKAQALDHVRDEQVKFILKPIADQLLAAHEQSGSEKKLRQMLEMLRKPTYSLSAGYTAGNILNLLVYLNTDLMNIIFHVCLSGKLTYKGYPCMMSIFQSRSLQIEIYRDFWQYLCCCFE